MTRQESDEALRPMARSPDEVSIGEIAPAMRSRLRTIGWIGGFIVALVVLAGMYFSAPFLKGVLVSRFHFDAITAIAISHLLDNLGRIGLFVWPLIGARISLQLELRYRRLHGKWRWEQ